MSQVEKLGPNSSSADVIAVLERDGGVIIEDFVSAELIDAIKRDLFPLLEKTSNGRDRFSGNQTRRLSRLFAHTRHCAPIITHPLFLPVAEHFIRRPVRVWTSDGQREMLPDVRIGMTQAIQIGPGQGAQPLHRDDTAFMWRHPSSREGRVQIMLAVSDFTAENGGTLVIPGSHKWDDDRQPLMSEAIPTVMRSGSALIFLGSTFHAGGTNRTTSELRTGLTTSLDSSNVRQEENMYLSLPTEVVASYPEQIQRLLGWSAGANHMGWIEVDGQMIDPIHLLKSTPSDQLVGVAARKY